MCHMHSFGTHTQCCSCCWQLFTYSEIAEVFLNGLKIFKNFFHFLSLIVARIVETTKVMGSVIKNGSYNQSKMVQGFFLSFKVVFTSLNGFQFCFFCY